MDNTFWHGTNYIEFQLQDPQILGLSSLNDPGGQGHVPIWNEMLTNEDFLMIILIVASYATTDLSWKYDSFFLDSMVAFVIDPEMPANHWEVHIQSDLMFKMSVILS